MTVLVQFGRFAEVPEVLHPRTFLIDMTACVRTVIEPGTAVVQKKNSKHIIKR